MNDLHEFVEDLHVKARGLFRDVPDADGRVQCFVVQPLKFGGSHPGSVRGVPAVGEGNAEFLGDRSK